MRWGCLGASRILGRTLLPALRAAGETVVVLGARDGDRARVLASEWGIPEGSGYDEVIARADLDAVYISVVNDAHVPLTIRALASGKHVLCEKPLAPTQAEVEAVREAERASGRRVMEAFVYGFHPQVAALLDAVRSGALGTVVSVDAHFANRLDDPGDFRWQARHGGGALLDLGTYCVSLLRDVIGREPGRVAGFATVRGDVDATLAGTLDFGTAVATFGCSFDGARAQWLRVVGTGGTAFLEVPFSSRNRLVVSAVNGRQCFWPALDPYVGMVAHFVAAVAGSGLRHGTDEALRQARVLDALAESARSGGVVTVDRSSAA